MTCWSILAKNYIISLEKCMFIIDVFLYVDFQNKLKIHAAFQVLYWQYCIQPREFLIFLITNNPPHHHQKKKYRYCCNSTVATVLLQQYSVHSGCVNVSTIKLLGFSQSLKAMLWTCVDKKKGGTLKMNPCRNVNPPDEWHRCPCPCVVTVGLRVSQMTKP